MRIASPYWGVRRRSRHPSQISTQVSPLLLTMMDKDFERGFLDTYSRALVSLPFDIKVLLEAVSDADLERSVREIAAAAAVHMINPKDGNVEPVVRFAEDVVLLRLVFRRISRDGGADADVFKDRFPENFANLDEELALFEKAFGTDVVTWMDSRWPSLMKVVYAKKRIPQFVDDDEVATFLYDEGLRFATNYPVTEKFLAGKLKQGQTVVEHLQRKRDQDRKKIST